MIYASLGEIAIYLSLAWIATSVTFICFNNPWGAAMAKSAAMVLALVSMWAFYAVAVITLTPMSQPYLSGFHPRTLEHDRKD